MCNFTRLHTTPKAIPFYQSFLFFFVLFCEEAVFAKKLHWNMIFSVLLGKIEILFPKEMAFLFAQNMKTDLLNEVQESMKFSVRK